MLVKSDPQKENAVLLELIDSDPKILEQHERFQAEMDFKQKLIDLRKTENMTQKEVGERSGLTQQAISRLEKGKGATIETVIRYLSSFGYNLDIKRI